MAASKKTRRPVKDVAFEIVFTDQPAKTKKDKTAFQIVFVPDEPKRGRKA